MIKSKRLHYTPSPFQKRKRKKNQNLQKTKKKNKEDENEISHLFDTDNVMTFIKYFKISILYFKFLPPPHGSITSKDGPRTTGTTTTTPRMWSNRCEKQATNWSRRPCRSTWRKRRVKVSILATLLCGNSKSQHTLTSCMKKRFSAIVTWL